MIKKLTLLASTVASLLAPAKAFADETLVINAPAGKGYSRLDYFIENVLVVAFGIAAIVVLVMLVWGAFEWITSGGDKESVGKARSRIINALIGLAVLAVAYALATVAANFLGFNLTNITIPSPR